MRRRLWWDGCLWLGSIGVGVLPSRGWLFLIIIINIVIEIIIIGSSSIFIMNIVILNIIIINIIIIMLSTASSQSVS